MATYAGGRRDVGALDRGEGVGVGGREDFAETAVLEDAERCLEGSAAEGGGGGKSR